MFRGFLKLLKLMNPEGEAESLGEDQRLTDMLPTCEGVHVEEIST